MNQLGLTEFATKARAQVFDHILPFWCGPALDREQGGWLPWISNSLQVDRSQPKGLIVNSRILWAFSAAFRASPKPLYSEMAQRAFEFVWNKFWDKQHGGAFWRLDSSGAVMDDAKKIYGQAFYIYALAEYHQAFIVQGSPGEKAVVPGGDPLGRAIDLFELVEAHASDARQGGYFEVCRRNWSEAKDSRLSDKDMNEKKSMNNHLHILEAYSNLYRVWKDARLAAHLRELIAIFEQRITTGPPRHFNHFFDEEWNVRSQTYTFGHDIEGSWLLCEAAEVLGDASLLHRVECLALELADAALNEGLDEDGGLCYEGQAGRIVDRRKECWPQAEAVVGFLNAYELSGQDRYLEAANRVWNYIEAKLVDRENGEWFWRINLDGRPDPSLPKVSEWKGPYHGTRACLETIRRLDRISKE